MLTYSFTANSELDLDFKFIIENRKFKEKDIYL